MTEAVPAAKSVLAAEQALGHQLLMGLVDEIKALKTHWHVTPQQQQEEIIDRLSDRIGTAVRAAVAILAKGQYAIFEANVDSVTIKKQVKIVLMAPRDGSAHDLMDATGSNVIVVLTDAEQYLAGMQGVRGDADQPQLPGLSA